MKGKAILIAVMGLSVGSSQGQSVIRESAGRPGMSPEMIEFTPGTQPDFVKGSVLIKEKGNYRQTNEVLFRHSETDQLGQEHYRYQQTINGFPVEGTAYIVHVAGGKIKSENGVWLSESPKDIATAPALSGSAALQAAMNAFGAKVYKWQLPAEEQFIKKESGNADATFKPKGELVYYSGETETSASKMRLAYKFDIYAHQPVGRRIYFVDAENGSILGQREIMHTITATGTATTVFSGTQTITTDNYNSSYRLRDYTRGNAISTFNLNKGTDYSMATDFTDADNSWNNVNANSDQYAADAHWAAETTYDYYKNTFNRNSINNAGHPLNSYMHYSTGFLNAFWDGSRMTYGDGNSLDSYTPPVSIDICGHEITHGLTSFTAGLYYSGESGALNEGFSDIFGTTIEFYAKGAAANWQIGEAFYTFRSMSNPKSLGQPNTYKGINWATGTADNGGVHANNGVINYWYYLLASGGSGTNDNSYAYTVSGIGLSKAAAIAYRTLTVYLVSSSQYPDARKWSIQAAADLYGATSTEVTQVIAAWNAVGVPDPVVYTPPVCSDNYEYNDARNNSKSLALNSDLSAQIGTNTDKDYFVFTTTASAPNIKVTLSNLAADYDVLLYNSKGRLIGQSQNRGNTAESITYNTSNTGNYYIQILGYNGAYNTSTCYTVRAATSSINQLYDNTADTSNQNIISNQERYGMNEDAVSVFPNPAHNEVNVSFTAEEDGKQTVFITDLMGRTVLTTSADVLAGPNTIKLNTDQLHTGIYFLQVSGKRAAKFQAVE